MENKYISTETFIVKDNIFIGLISLSKPKQMNALDMDMSVSIRAKLTKWKDDPNIKLIIITSIGSSFCSGGDIKKLYNCFSEYENAGHKNDITSSYSYKFIENTYKLIGEIYNFPKPIIGVSHGITMGIGMGVFMATKYRISSTSAKFAMPEVSIGTYPDAGAGLFFSQLDNKALGYFLALTGVTISSSDALLIGFTDHIFSADGNMAYEIIGTIKRLFSEEINDNLIKKSLSRISIKPNFDENSLIKKASLEINSCFDSVDLYPNNETEAKKQLIKIIKNIKNHKINYQDDKALHLWQSIQNNINYSSPLALFLTFRHINKVSQSQSSMDASEIIEKHDLRLSTKICQYNYEMKEGVRALLIDKDKSPKWSFKSVDDIDEIQIEKKFF